MLEILILVCAAAQPPGACNSTSALDVIHGPEAANEVMCAMHAQAFLAQTSLVPVPGQTYMKIVCRREKPVAAIEEVRTMGAAPEQSSGR